MKRLPVSTSVLIAVVVCTLLCMGLQSGLRAIGEMFCLFMPQLCDELGEIARNIAQGAFHWLQDPEIT